MKALVVANDTPVRQALTAWFDRRGRAWEWVKPQALQELGASDLIDTIIVELATLDDLQMGTVLSISGEARHHLVELAEETGCPVLFVSDGRVYDGDYAPLNHRESESVQPASLAGARLCAIENLLAKHLERHFVLRTGPVFCEHGDNFFTRLFARLKGGGELGLNSILKTCPTHVDDLARVLSAVIDQLSCGAGNWGCYHYNSSGQTSAYEFADVMLAFASQYIDLPVSKESLAVNEAGLALKPAVPVLRCEKILHHFGIKQLPWRSYLPEPIKILCEGDK